MTKNNKINPKHHKMASVGTKAKAIKSGKAIKVKPKPLSIEDRMVRDAIADGDPTAAIFIDTVLGRIRPIDRAICSDGPLVGVLAANLRASLSREIKESGSQYGVQTTRIGLSPIGSVRFDIAEARKALAKVSRAKVDAIAGLRFGPAVDPDLGDCIALEVETLIFGSNAQGNFVMASRRSRRRSAVYYDSKGPIWSLPDDFALLKGTLNGLFKAPYTRLPGNDPFFDPEGEFTDRWGPTDRAVMTLMCRSQMPVRKMLIGYGAGRHIVSGAVQAAEHALKDRCRSGRELVHRDEIPHRWFGELLRRGLDDVSVPVILLP